MSNTTKHDLIVDVSKTTGLTQADTKIVVEELLETVARNLESAKNIEIRGFGTFYTRMRNPDRREIPRPVRSCRFTNASYPFLNIQTNSRSVITGALRKKARRNSGASPKRRKTAMTPRQRGTSRFF